MEISQLKDLCYQDKAELKWVMEVYRQSILVGEPFKVVCITDSGHWLSQKYDKNGIAVGKPSSSDTYAGL